MDLTQSLLERHQPPATHHPPVAISACLAGQAVRYDGTDKFLEATSSILGKHLQLITICPEVAAGMGIPRPPIQLVASDSGISALGRDDPGLDMTDALADCARQSLSQWGNTLCGYIFKSRSPSCGLDTTPVFDHQGHETHRASGLQADYFQRHAPWLQMTDENQLATGDQCRAFITRCQILAHLKSNATGESLAALHQHYMALVEHMTHDQQQNLVDALQTHQATHYWQTFGTCLNTLFKPNH